MWTGIPSDFVLNGLNILKVHFGDGVIKIAGPKIIWCSPAVSGHINDDEDKSDVLSELKKLGWEWFEYEDASPEEREGYFFIQ